MARLQELTERDREILDRLDSDALANTPASGCSTPPGTPR